MGKHANSVDSQVLQRIQGHGPGWVFTPTHFLDLGSRAAVGSVLKRLKAAGRIRQLAHGLYDYPIHHPLLGEIAPSSEEIASALKVREAIRLQPSGDYALNILGLSEQVPARVVFLTDGPARRVQVGKREIVLQHTTPRNMAAQGKSGLVIQAMRRLGKSRVSEEVVAQIGRQLNEAEREQLKRDLPYAPGWIAQFLRRLADESQPAMPPGEVAL